MINLIVEVVNTCDLNAQIREEVIKVFSHSFDVSLDASACLEHYFANVKSLCLAWDEAKLTGFQFYQEKEIAGRTVHHFSLAGRLPDTRYRGLQARFGSMLIRKAITKTLPWKPVFLAGVTNSPKSYANMYAVGGKCFPDVVNPEAENPFSDWYTSVAESLRLNPVDYKGLLRDRMQTLGFSLQKESTDSHALGQAYDRYVEYQRNHGVFTLIEIVPIRDIPLYLLKKLFQPKKGISCRIQKHHE